MHSMEIGPNSMHKKYYLHNCPSLVITYYFLRELTTYSCSLYDDRLVMFASVGGKIQTIVAEITPVNTSLLM